MKAKPRDPSDVAQLRQLVRKESNAKQRDRYRVVLFAIEGMNGKDMDGRALTVNIARPREERPPGGGGGGGRREFGGGGGGRRERY